MLDADQTVENVTGERPCIKFHYSIGEPGKTLRTLSVNIGDLGLFLAISISRRRQGAVVVGHQAPGMAPWIGH